jgi:hypothetical protein
VDELFLGVKRLFAFADGLESVAPGILAQIVRIELAPQPGARWQQVSADQRQEDAAIAMVQLIAGSLIMGGCPRQKLVKVRISPFGWRRLGRGILVGH